jgi:hypothetical protein
MRVLGTEKSGMICGCQKHPSVAIWQTHTQRCRSATIKDIADELRLDWDAVKELDLNVRFLSRTMQCAISKVPIATRQKKVAAKIITCLLLSRFRKACKSKRAGKIKC